MMRKITAALLSATITALLVATLALAQPAEGGDAGKVLLCHQGEEGPETISVSANAVPAHQEHGEALGACGDGGGGGEACTLVGEPVETYPEGTEDGASPQLVDRTEILAIYADKPIVVDEYSLPTITVQDAAGNTHTFVFTGETANAALREHDPADENLLLTAYCTEIGPRAGLLKMLVGRRVRGHRKRFATFYRYNNCENRCRSLRHCATNGLTVLPVSKPPKRFALYLPDPLPGDVQLVAELGEARRFKASQTIPAC